MKVRRTPRFRKWLDIANEHAELCQYGLSHTMLISVARSVWGLSVRVAAIESLPLCSKANLEDSQILRPIDQFIHPNTIPLAEDYP